MKQDSGYQACTPEDFLDHEGVDYRRTSGSRGPQFNIKECPLCGGTAWKVYLSVDTGYGNCFHGSCGASFNLWTFAKAHLGTTDNKAIGELFDRIAKTVGWKPKARAPKPVVAVFEGSLKLPMSTPAPTGGIPYLNSRGVPVSLQQQFGLRMCSDGAFFYKKEDGEQKRMIFSGRLIIPIYDLAGKLVTFQGRDTTGDKDPKYLFPPRLPSTARFLYNGHRAFAEKWAHIVMGEGALDTIAIQRGIDGDYAFTGMGAVGSFGKSLTLDFEPGMETQLQALLALKANGMKIITILWDGEKEAIASAVKAARKLVGHGFLVRLGFLPRGKDPDDVAPETVRKAIASALPYSRSLDARIKLRNPYR
jgi:DNA primase